MDLPDASDPNSKVGTCVFCDAGKFKASTGTQECQNCLAGTYAFAPGATFCQPCPTGKWLDRAVV